MYIPDSTYRFQFNKDFTLSHLKELIPFLHTLGISTIYASPVLDFEKGNENGYAVTDPTKLNPEIGTVEEWDSIAVELKLRGMGWLQDIVPNHMAYSKHNPWLADVFQHGPHSRSFNFFDWLKSNSIEQYRRFFAVDGLISLRMEDDKVFTIYHGFLKTLFDRGLIQGFRVDHIDGLADPGGYCKRLRSLVGTEGFIVVEKILAEGEDMPQNWEVQGTTGYEFLSHLNQLFSDAEGKQQLETYYSNKYSAKKFADVVFKKKYEFIQSEFSVEVNHLCDLLTQLYLAEGWIPDTENTKEAIGILMASMPVYRIYPDQFPLSAMDQFYINEAFGLAEIRNPSLDFNKLRMVFNADKEDAVNKRRLAFIRRWSQFTGAVAAKGTEDAAFYIFNPLISHNEVGDSPVNTNLNATVFHEKMIHRQQTMPYALNASSTHDTKRGEDNRLRINMITVFSKEWIRMIESWTAMNQSFIQYEDKRRMPTERDEYLIYQSMVGGWGSGDFLERFLAFITKALREGNHQSNWRQPDTFYEEACLNFVKNILSPNHNFSHSFQSFFSKIERAAMKYTLGQALLKTTAPGIPDIYQGSERMNLFFVDPDNRQRIDYSGSIGLLQEIREAEKNGMPSLMQCLDKYAGFGSKKLFILHKILRYRRSQPALFSKAAYIPVASSQHWIAYYRKNDQKKLLVIASLPSQQPDTTEEGLEMQGIWKNLLTDVISTMDGRHNFSELCREFGIGLFEQSDLN